MKNTARLIQLCTNASKFDGKFEWQAAGMSYIIMTKEGRFIFIDGGYADDAYHMIEKARQLSGKENIEIALWILTHPHGDHYGALFEVAKKSTLQQNISFGKLCCKIPEDFKLPGSGKSFEGDKKSIDRIMSFFGDRIVTPEIGDSIKIDDISIEFLYVPSENDRLTDVNELSLIFRVHGENKTVMFTGDAYASSTAMLARTMKEKIASDICQLSHHGLNGACDAFYTRVKASTVLIPTSKSGDKYIKAGSAGYVPRMLAVRLAEKVICAYEGDIELEI